MSSERWEKVNELFYAALEHDPEQRHLFLLEACGTDDLLRQEVESLLSAHHGAGNFIQTPAVKNALEILADDSEQLNIGQQIGPYKIIREIGRGGMGAVYLAERADRQYEKHVAVKLVKRGMDSDQVLQRFRNERQILANFDHPNIARLLDGGSTQNGLPYFVMEYVEGRPIDEYCDSKNLTISERLDLFCQVCTAVSYAHRHLVIHRDIKPSNILVTDEGVPKLLDFGIAKVLQPENDEETRATAAGLRLMTPDYASPEQILGISVTTATDIYSLGIVLYELLTGHRPYRFHTYSAMEMARLITETEPQMPSTVIRTVEENNDKTTPESVSRIREGSPDRLSRRLRGDLDNIVLMAMRKEPPRRYPSVELFSEDIHRHLAGLPVNARKDTVAYRSSKFVRRNKIAVAAATFALLAIVVSGIIAGIIQWRANQQAKYLQEFGQEAARIEGIMRFAYLMPLHDTSPEREIVMKRIRAIHSRMAELGSSAQGPGHYAIGRGLMALQQYEDARKQFERAMNDHGYKTPEVAYSYGLTLAMLYQTELQAAARISSKELRETRLKEIKTEFKEPALSYIRAGSHSSEYSEYAEAVVEFLDERYEKAIQKSEKALQQNPWLYESERLEGEAYRIIGRESYNKGNHSQALDSYTKADKAFELSIRKGASDPLGYVDLCTLKSSILRVQIRTGAQADSTYLMGKECCQKALQADRKNAAAYLALSYLHIAWAENYSNRQMEYRRPVLELAVQAAQNSILLQPQSSEMHKALGMAYSNLAFEDILHTRDPSKVVAAGNESYKKAIQINPNDVDSHLWRAWMLWYLAEYLRDTGADPRTTLEDAYQSLKTAIRLNPNYFSAYHCTGNILYSKGAYEVTVGLDPTDSLDSSLQMLQKSIKINPGYLNAYISLGYAAVIKGEYLSLVGRNPYESLNLAEETYQNGLRINPNFHELFRGLAHSNMRKGEFCVKGKTDPTVYLKQARFFIKKAFEADKSSRDIYTTWGEIELVDARWKMLQHKTADPELKSAVQWLNHALEVDSSPNYFDAWYSKAKVYQKWAEWKLETKRSADKEIRLGLDMVSRALEIKPHSAEMIGMRGVFLLFQAHSISNITQRRELAEKARTDLEEALRMNRNFSYTFTPFLKEAEILRNRL